MNEIDRLKALYPPRTWDVKNPTKRTTFWLSLITLKVIDKRSAELSKQLGYKVTATAYIRGLVRTDERAVAIEQELLNKDPAYRLEKAIQDENWN